MPNEMAMMKQNWMLFLLRVLLDLERRAATSASTARYALVHIWETIARDFQTMITTMVHVSSPGGTGSII